MVPKVKCSRCGDPCDVPRTFPDKDGFNRQICHACYTLLNNNLAYAEEQAELNVDVKGRIEYLETEYNDMRQGYYSLLNDLTTSEQAYHELLIEFNDLQAEYASLSDEYEAYKLAHPAE